MKESVKTSKGEDGNVTRHTHHRCVMLEDAPKDIVIKTLKMWCVFVSVLVFACTVCVCMCVCAV